MSDWAPMDDKLAFHLINVCANTVDAFGDEELGKHLEVASDYLRTRLADFDALKAEVERLDSQVTTAVDGAFKWRDRAEKAEAELVARKEIMAEDFLEITRLKAELEAQRPLIEAVMGADIEMGVIPFCRRGSEQLLRAALALREGGAK